MQNDLSTFAILSRQFGIAPENIRPDDSASYCQRFIEFCESVGITPAHTLAEIADYLRANPGHSYINAPDLPPFTDGFIPCRLAAYLADCTRYLHQSGYNGISVITAILAEFNGSDEITVYIIDAA